MKNLGTLFSCALLLVSLVSCIPSFRPVSDTNETENPKFTGTWGNEDNLYDVSLGDGFYKILCTGKDYSVDYKMILSKVDDEVYASIGLRRESDINKEFEAFETFALPIYRLYRIEVSDSEIKLIWPMNDDGKIPTPEGINTAVLSDNDFVICEKDGSKIKDWIRKNKELFKIKSAKASWGDTQNVFTFKRVEKKDAKTESK